MLRLVVEIVAGCASFYYSVVCLDALWGGSAVGDEACCASRDLDVVA